MKVRATMEFTPEQVAAITDSAGPKDRRALVESFLVIAVEGCIPAKLKHYKQRQVKELKAKIEELELEV